MGVSDLVYSEAFLGTFRVSDLLMKIEATPTFDNVPDFRRSYAANRPGELRQAMFSLAVGCVRASSHYKPRLEGLSFKGLVSAK
jgi:hypothetical protein